MWTRATVMGMEITRIRCLGSIDPLGTISLRGASQKSSPDFVLSVIFWKWAIAYTIFFSRSFYNDLVHVKHVEVMHLKRFHCAPISLPRTPQRHEKLRQGPWYSCGGGHPSTLAIAMFYRSFHTAQCQWRNWLAGIVTVLMAFLWQTNDNVPCASAFVWELISPK